MVNIIHINSDEEIMSLISRAKRSKSRDIILVVPQRSIILESLTNLYLLKKELDKYGKYFVLITQDARGLAYARRAGIETHPYSYLMELQQSGVLKSIEQEQKDPRANSQQQEFSQRTEPLNSSVDSSDPSFLSSKEEYVEEGDAPSPGYIRRSFRNVFGRKEKKPIEITSQKEETSLEPPQEEMNFISQYDVVIPKNQDREERMGMDTSHKEIEPSFYGNKLEEFYKRESAIPHQESHVNQYEYGTRDFERAEESAPEAFVRDVEQEGKEKYVPRKKTSSILSQLLLLMVLISVFLGGFFLWKYIPKANLVLSMTRLSSKGEIPVSVSITQKDPLIQSETFFETVTLTESFPATGSSGSDVTRAGGYVTIYNEYSEQSQVLVATTRILSEDEKVYRTVQSVVVPGKKMENGEMVPGKVEVEVRADASGESYNKGPSRFTIPGFKGTPKYEFFYAKSEQPFVGGGKEGSGISLVSSSDIEKARLGVETKVRQEAFRRISEETKEGWTIFPEAMHVSIEDSQAFPGENIVADTFEYSMTARVQVQAMRTSDLEAYVRKEFESKVIQDMKIREGVSWIPEQYIIEYKEIIPNTDYSELSFKASGEIVWIAKIDEEKFVEEVLSKTTDEITNTVLPFYSGIIEKINITQSPKGPEFLFPRIPSVRSRIVVETL